MLTETVRQIFERPSDSVLSEIAFDAPSLNLYRFAGFDVGHVGLDSVAESIDAVALTMTYAIDSLVMLPGNRVRHWSWFSELRLIGGDPTPAVSPHALDSFFVGHDFEESEDARPTKEHPNANLRRHHTATQINAAMELVRRGASLPDVADQTGISVTSLKRAKQKTNNGKKLISTRASNTLNSPHLLRFNDDGEKVIPLTPSEEKQVYDLLRAGIHYRQVSEMLDLCARDVRLLGIQPQEQSS